MELFVEIRDSPYKYDYLTLKPEQLIRNSRKVTKRKRKKQFVDSYLLHYLVKEFDVSPSYRTSFLKAFFEHSGADFLKFVLLPTKEDLIDYNW